MENNSESALELVESEVEVEHIDQLERVEPGPQPAETTTITMPVNAFRGERTIVNGVETKIGPQPDVGVATSMVVEPNLEQMINEGKKLGSGIAWDTVEPATQINVTVSFVTSMTFSMSLFGKAVI